MLTDDDFLLRSYMFDLPQERIAQFPPQRRGDSRLMVMDRRGDAIPEHRMFADLPACLPPGALLVANNSRVFPARLIGTRATGGKVEFLPLTPLPLALRGAVPAGDGGEWSAEVEGLVRAGGRIRDGETLRFGAGIRVTVLESGPFGRRRARLSWSGDLAGAFAAAGRLPLPPYIRRPDGDGDAGRYQTVYAREDKTGSVAAPTAGLHFTGELRRRLREAGFGWAEVTLYVGYGTFSPVRCEDIRRHVMHREYVEVGEEAAGAVARARAEGRPVVAVGTTSARTLEGVALNLGEVRPFAGWTDIFLYPGRPFRVIDGLLTNFHLPGSSLLMLVSAFAGRGRVLDAYREAVREGYRFFSYGDAMLLR